MQRLVDIVLSFLGLLVLSPIILVIGVIILLTTGAPVLFKQRRPGLRAKPFIFYKFRTMNQERNKDGKLLPDQDRITKLGKLLRKTSLDELPSFLNVIKGDMNLVGPRPLLMEYLDRYTPEQNRRHEVNPGITGWAQVNGRNAITWEEKFELDVWYVDNQSFWLDLKILFITIWKVLEGEGISNSGFATMPEFMGTNNE
jgi:sugar transferase EpsL